jgi:proline-specific peptidase
MCAAIGLRLYVVIAADSWKARQISNGHKAAVTVPIRRGGLLALAAPIPPATVGPRSSKQCRARGPFEGGPMILYRAILRRERRHGARYLEASVRSPEGKEAATMTSTNHKKTSVSAASGGMTGAAPEGGPSWRGARLLKIRDVSLFADVIGHGYPLLLMHGGPSLDHWSLLPFRQCADQFTVIFYDHRCNGRSTGAPVSMTWENLTADAEALRERLGFERWAVLGHSFGGQVALEYALRYPGSLSRLVLLDTGGEARWAQQNAADLLARRGYSPKKVRLVRRWFNGEFAPYEYVPMAMRIGPAYYHRPSLWLTAREEFQGGWHTKYRPQALIFAGRHLVKGWTVLDRLGEITVPTLVMAGSDDFVFPPECQRELADGIPNARLQIIDRAGHLPHSEQTAEVMAAIRHFLSADTPAA